MITLFTHTKNRNFIRLWLAQLISQFGDRIHQLALVGLIAERAPGSTMGLAKLIAFTILPVFIIQPFAGVFVDRWDRRATLFICDLFRGLIVLTIPFIFMYHDSMIPIYGVVFLVFCFSRFYFPAKMSLIPDIVDEESLFMANSLVSTTGMIAFVFGCALGGFLIDWYGARNGFIIDAGTFFFSGLIIFSIHLPLNFKREKFLKTTKEIIGPIRKSVWREMKEGFDYLIRHKEIRFIIDMLFVLLAAAGSVYVVIIVFIQKAFGSVTKHLGVIAVTLGIGLFLGALAYGKWGKKFAWHKVIFFCLSLGGVVLTLFAFWVHFTPEIKMAMILAFLLGLILGPIFIAINTVVHLLSDKDMRGKVFSALEIVIHFAFLVAMLASSWASEFIGGLWILVITGTMMTLVGAVGFLKKNHGFKIEGTA